MEFFELLDELFDVVSVVGASKLIIIAVIAVGPSQLLVTVVEVLDSAWSEISNQIELLVVDVVAVESVVTVVAFLAFRPCCNLRYNCSFVKFVVKFEIIVFLVLTYTS